MAHEEKIINPELRETGKKLLSSVIKLPKNCDIVEKYIYQHATDLEYDYLWCIYQVYGMFLKTPGQLKTIAQQIKEGKIGWKNTVYDDIASKIEEFDEYLVKPFEVVEGVSECQKCGSKKTWSVQRQVRKADEPMSTFSRCVMCGHSWVYSG